MRRKLWLLLNDLRVWMVHRRMSARTVNAVSRACVRLYRECDVT